MNFSTAQKVIDTIDASEQVEATRATNRSKINDLFNGRPPLNADEAKKLNIKINVNWGEAAVLAHHARRQYNNAFTKRGSFFRVTLPLAPNEKQQEWSVTITNSINRKLKKSLPFLELYRNKFASVVSHGLGPQIWYNDYSWLPKFVPLEDLRVPTDTLVSMENLQWFAVRHYYTPGELVKKVFNENSRPGWDKEAVATILNDIHDKNYDTTDYNWMDNPEKMADLYKQNLGFYSSDAVPTIPLWHFFYQEEGDKGWKLCVVPVTGSNRVTDGAKFLYKTNRIFAKELSQIIHLQVGDLSSKAPFLYHSVRSLGFLLMEPCYWTNLFRCRFMQHGFESMNAWFRLTDPAGRARAQKIEMFDRAVIPEGVSIVPQNERHQIDGNLVESIMAQLKQLQSEAGASYTQEIDTGTQKEQTATETMAKVQQVNAMLSGLLGTAFAYETFAYMEICRRFCLSKSPDKDVQKFHEEMKSAGIPRVYLNAEQWDIEPEIPMGNGNPTMEIAQAKELLQMRPMFGPEAQQEILHEATTAITGDPRKASRWVPIGERTGVSDAQRDAEFAFGALMQGVQVKMKEGLNPIEQIETLLTLAGQVAQRIERTGNMATTQEVAGLVAVAQYAGALIKQLAEDKAQGQRVKQYEDALGQLMNAMKGFAQRLQQQRQSQNSNLSPDAVAKVKSQLLLANSKAKISEQNAQLKMAHKDRQFSAEQRRKNYQVVADQKRQDMVAAGELSRNRLKSLSDE